MADVVGKEMFGPFFNDDNSKDALWAVVDAALIAALIIVIGAFVRGLN